MPHHVQLILWCAGEALGGGSQVTAQTLKNRRRPGA